MPSYLGEYCSDCGAGIRGVPRQIIHDEFHQKFDELIEWAQHISDLMESEVGRQSSGKMLGPNPGLLMGENE